jgi:hypothetical protein
MAYAVVDLMLTTHRTLNHTFTPMAARLLRVTLLSPLNGWSPHDCPGCFSSLAVEPRAIEARLDCVEGAKLQTGARKS